MTIAVRGAATDLRGEIASAVATVLRLSVDEIADDATFASLGLDSLAAAELTADLEDLLGVDVPLTAVHEFPTVASLARYLSGDGGDDNFARMRADAVLPDDIHPGTGTPGLTRDARTILLTGATGFLGAHVLRRLLDETACIVICLVRNGRVTAPERVAANAVKYGLATADMSERVLAVEGDLASPLLGLGQRAFAALARRVDAVIHVGASVDWVQSYESLRAANVLGTREVLRLACTGTPKPVHFVSSLSACYSTKGPRVVDEGADALRYLEGVHFGYAQSKCVGEALVLEAGRRGLPVSIIRPALVSGDSLLGRSNVDDLLTRIIAGCIRMGAAPDLDWRVDSVPVDHVATAIVRSALAHAGGVATLHVSARSPRHWRECALWMHMRGYPMALVGYREWCERLENEATPEHPMYSLRPFFLRTIAEEGLTIPEAYEESRRARIADDRSRSRLASVGAPCATIDSALLSRYFDRYIEEGIVPDIARQRPAFTPRPRGLEPLYPALCRSLDAIEIEQVAMERLGADASIISELTSLREGADVGLFRGTVHARTGEGSRSTPVIVKVKPSDDVAIAMIVGVAQLSSPELGSQFERFSHRLALSKSHVREIEVYRLTDPRFRRNMPAAFALSEREGAGRWTIVMEQLPEVELSHVGMDDDGWPHARLEVVVRGMAEFQSVWMGREDELRELPWLLAERTVATVTDMAPLYAVLADHAIAKSPAWALPGLAEVHVALLEAIPQWSAALERLPRTLIHNDFNPRNIAVRGGAEPSLCAFDWEAAALGVPQRDLAELLTWTLSSRVSCSEVAWWIERARVLLSEACGSEMNREEWELGFRAALVELFVDRLSMYAMVDHIRPQPYLPRVIRTWLALQRLYPWVTPG